MPQTHRTAPEPGSCRRLSLRDSSSASSCCQSAAPLGTHQPRPHAWTDPCALPPDRLEGLSLSLSGWVPSSASCTMQQPSQVHPRWQRWVTNQETRKQMFGSPGAFETEPQPEPLGYMYACNPHCLSRRPVEALFQLHSFIDRQSLRQYIVPIPSPRRQAFCTTLLSTHHLSVGEFALSSTSHGKRTLHPHWGCLR